MPIADLIFLLKCPPFGLKDGPIPLLVVLQLLIGADDLALFKEGAYIPLIEEADLELMVKRPELFSIKRFAPVGTRGKIFRVYQEFLNTSPAVPDDRIRNATMVSIVGPMVQFANNLPPCVKSPRSLSNEARKVFRVLLNAKDPIALFFADLPEAVGIVPFETGESVDAEKSKAFQARFRNAIVELSQACPRLLELIELSIRDAFKADKKMAKFREELASRAASLVERCSDRRLKPLVAAFAANKGQDAKRGRMDSKRG